MSYPASTKSANVSASRTGFRADGKRLRMALRQRVRQDRRLAWKMLPLLLILFVALLGYGLNFDSRLGELGIDLSRIGQVTSFESPIMDVQPTPSPPIESKPSEAVVEQKEQELSTSVEMESTLPDIKVQELAPIQVMELDIKVESSSIVDISELAMPEEMPEAEKKPTPKASKKTTPPAQLASNPSQSNLGQSASKAVGRISVSYKKAPQPPYPARLRASKTNGTVIVRIQVDATGKPQSVSIKQGSGHAEFDDIARSWILHNWLFNPAQENGQSVASVVTTSIHFVYG